MAYNLTRTNEKVYSLTKTSWTLAPYPNDLSFYAMSRSGLSLVDEYGNDATIIPSCVTINATATPYLALRTGVVPTTGTIMIIRGSYTNLTDEGNGSEFYLCAADLGGMRWGIRWGDYTGYSVAAHHGTSDVLTDNNWHTFIIYNGKLWLCEPDISLTDTNITTIITSWTPLIDMTGVASWVAATQDIRLLCNYAYNTPQRGNRALTYIGTITDGVITWVKKYVFTNSLNAYDILGGGTKITYLNNVGGTTVGNQTTRSYSEYGYDLLTEGHTSCYLAGTGVISIPKAISGYITDYPATYIKLNDHAGNITQHNLADSLIEFSGSLWDRSNATIYANAARAAATFYDAGNPKRWHITELNNLLFTEWVNASYRGRIFVHEYPNSCQIEDKTILNEIFTYNTNKTGGDYYNVLKYTDDFDIIVI